MNRFRSIIYVTDRKVVNRDGLTRAVNLANNNGARLTVVELMEEPPNSLKLFKDTSRVKAFHKDLITSHQKELNAFVEPWQQTISIETAIIVGTPFLELIGRVLEDQHDLVIKQTERSGPSFDSNEMHILRKCPCPVWLFKPELHSKFRTIVAAVDVNDFYAPEEMTERHALNCQILEMAVSLAISEFAKLHIVHVWEPIGESVLLGPARLTESEVASFVEDIEKHHADNLGSFLQEMTDTLGSQSVDYVVPETHVIRGEVSSQIPAFANKTGADLIVMGTVARSGIAGFFMGNTAEKILTKIDCSVLAVKPRGFKSPIEK